MFAYFKKFKSMNHYNFVGLLMLMFLMNISAETKATVEYDGDHCAFLLEIRGSWFEEQSCRAEAQAIERAKKRTGITYCNNWNSWHWSFKGWEEFKPKSECQELAFCGNWWCRSSEGLTNEKQYPWLQWIYSFVESRWSSELRSQSKDAPLNADEVKQEGWVPPQIEDIGPMVDTWGPTLARASGLALVQILFPSNCVLMPIEALVHGLLLMKENIWCKDEQGNEIHCLRGLMTIGSQVFSGEIGWHQMSVNFVWDYFVMLLILALYYGLTGAVTITSVYLVVTATTWCLLGLFLNIISNTTTTPSIAS